MKNNTCKFPIFSEKTNSYLSRHLSRDIFEALKNRSTPSGFTLEKAIKSGVANPDSSIGIYAGDRETYEVFSELLDPVIAEYHDFSKGKSHGNDLHLKMPDFPNPDPENKYILSTRIRVGRNLSGFPLGAHITKAQRREVEHKIRQVLVASDFPFQGTYASLCDLDRARRNELIGDHILFKEGDRFQEAAGLNRDFPQGRGIFHDMKKQFIVWINEEDQLRIISMQKNGDITQTFKRLRTALSAIEKKLAFSTDSRLGYITSCPTNLGTAMRASVHIRLPLLGENRELFYKTAREQELQIRGVDGEHSESRGGVYDLSNKRRLGVTEHQCLNTLALGAARCICLEKKLSDIKKK